MIYTCWGAAKQVTGSMHLLQLDSGFTILIDCGIDYEDRDNSIINANFPFDPKEVDALILTHAHIDHSGNIPNLIKQGYRGEIICTEPTAYLLDKLWHDSVSIQNSKRQKSKQKFVKLYGYKEIKDSLQQLLTLGFNQPFDISEDVRITLREAGHIIGAASVELEIKEKKKTVRFGFTGDLGNPGSKLIVDPVVMHDLDYLVTETTYGNRKHQDQESPEDVLLKYVTETCVKKPGKLIIPAFSVGRTQAVLFTLNKLFASGKIPPVRVFADSPLALASSNIHNRFSHYLNHEAKEFKASGQNLFNFKSLHIVEDDEDVLEMDMYRESSITVSSAGMLEGGRIQDHISAHIQNPLCQILIAGFCSKGTLGDRLLQGAHSIRIKGKDKLVYAKISRSDVFSAHPDVDGLTTYIGDTNSKRLKKMFFVHGEATSMPDLKEVLPRDIQSKVEIPEKGQSYQL